MLIKQLAQMIDHAILHPTMTDPDIKEGCNLAMAYGVASVCVKPYAVNLASKQLLGSNVSVGTVVGFPHGSNSTELKLRETEQCLLDGASEIDMVVNVGKVLSEDWSYVHSEIRDIYVVVKNHHALLKVIFENDFLPTDLYKIKLCEICNTIGVDFIKTSTGFGMVKENDGKYNYRGATEYDLKLMRKHAIDSVQLKASGGIKTLEDMQKSIELGATRIGTSSTQNILNDASLKYGENKISFNIGKELKGY